MKKLTASILTAVMVPLLLFGCSSSKTNTAESTVKSAQEEVIKVGTSTISKDVLEVAQKVFNEKSDKYEVEVVVFDDGITPNLGVDDGSIDANFYQYEDYLTNFNKDRGTKIKTNGKEVFAFQIGLYSNTVKDISEIKNGMKIAIANDAPNRALALSLLNKAGIIKLKDGVESPTILDIVENKHKLEFVEMERLNLANAVDDLDMAVVMADVMRQAGKDSENALAFEQEEGIVLAFKEEKEWVKELEEALISKEVKDYILEKTEGTKTPLF
jgi:D-methionine transport system substrate-binding protein